MKLFNYILVYLKKQKKTYPIFKFRIDALHEHFSEKVKPICTCAICRTVYFKTINRNKMTLILYGIIVQWYYLVVKGKKIGWKNTAS